MSEMQKNLEKYEEDLKKLQKEGKQLLYALYKEFNESGLRKAIGEDADAVIETLPTFKLVYQSWYSESLALIKQLLPDRVQDFVRHYEKPKTRKDITFENYKIEDYLQGLTVTRSGGYRDGSTVVGPSAALPLFQQQISILDAVASRFESSLFDIVQLVQADVFDSEVASARELAKKGFLRASGAVSGVVLERHLAQVAKNHNISSRKKNPTISDFNDLLKSNDVLDTPNWRQIQRLGDIRNLCDHNKDRDPTKEEVEELVSGVEKFLKTLF